MRVTSSFSGIAAMKAKIYSTRNYIHSRARTALRRETENVYRKSQSVVPEETGELKESGKIIPDYDNLEATIQYGPLPHAIPVHEYPDHAPPSWAGGVQFRKGGPKYLERPLRDATAGMDVRIGTRIKL